MTTTARKRRNNLVLSF